MAFTLAFFLLLSLLHNKVDSVLTPNPTVDMVNAATFVEDLFKIYNRANHDSSDIDNVLKKISIEIITLLYNSADSITKSTKAEKAQGLPANFHAPEDIENGLEEIDTAIKRVNRLFQPFFEQYLNQNISLISLKALMVKAIDTDVYSPQDSVQKIYQNIRPIEKRLEGFFSKLIQYMNTNLYPFCFFMNPRHYMVKLYESVVTMEIRMFVMNTFAHKLRSILMNSNYGHDLQTLKNEHLKRRYDYIVEMQKALSQESNEFFRCIPIYDSDYTPDQVFAVNLLLKESDYKNNRVVSGARFVIENKILHLQLEEGKLIPGGQIDPGSERWISVDDMDYDSSTFNQNNVSIPLHDDIEIHYIGLWDYLQYSTWKAPENFVVVGAKFEIHYLYPGDYLNKTIIHLRVKYANMDSNTGRIDSNNVMFSNLLTRQSSQLKRRLEKFEVGTDRDKQYINIGYAGYRVSESNHVLTHIDARSINLPLRTPLSGIEIYENQFFEGTKVASLKIFSPNVTPFYDYAETSLYPNTNKREKVFTCNVCKLK